MPSEFSISEFPEFLLPNSELCQSSRTKALEKNSDRTIAQSLRRTMSLADAPSQFLYSSVSMSNIDEIDVEKMPHRRSESDSSSVDSALTLTKSESEVSSEAKKRWSFTPDARFVSDTIIGLSDGLTVPFALTAGLSALGNTKVVIYGGLAELTAGAISMGLGGYLGAKSEEDSYKATEIQTRDQIMIDPHSTCNMISSVFSEFDVPQTVVDDLTMHLSKSPRLPDFLMRFHHSLAESPSSRAFVCALTIGLAYFFGGLVPLLPYFFVPGDRIDIALGCSIGTMIAALFVFGYTKTCFVSGWRGSRNAWKGTIGGVQMVVVGSVAAGSAMGLVKAFNALASDSAEMKG